MHPWTGIKVVVQVKERSGTRAELREKRCGAHRNLWHAEDKYNQKANQNGAEWADVLFASSVHRPCRVPCPRSTAPLHLRMIPMRSTG